MEEYINDAKQEYYSAPVQEILGFIPSWMIRWGITVILFLLVILMALAWMIKYPDIIQGNVLINTDSPVIKLKSEAEGIVQSIFKEEGSHLSINEPIAEVKSTLAREGVVFLNKLLNLNKDQINERVIATDIPLGAAQREYNQLVRSVTSLKSEFEKGKYLTKKRNLLDDIENYEELIEITKAQIKLIDLELEGANTRFLSQEELYDSGVIPKMEFIEEKARLLSKEKELQGQMRNLVQYKLTLSSTKTSLSELESGYREGVRILEEEIDFTLKNIGKILTDWEEKYIISSPIEGSLTFLQKIHENEYLNREQAPFAIIPDSGNYIGLLKIPEDKSGKVKVGQKVIISLFNYPSNEFGKLKGTVEEISIMPNESTYRVKVKLARVLITSYQKEIAYKPEMGGVAEIITEDLRLIERVFFTIKELVDNSR